MSEQTTPETPETPDNSILVQQIQFLKGMLSAVTDATDLLRLGAFWAFHHHYHADEANSAVHGSDVRYSPITFRLAEGLQAIEQALPLRFMSHEALQKVLDHKGRYPEDVGRIASDKLADNSGTETPA